MNRFFKTLVVSATLAATVVASAGTASADDWRWRHHRHHGGGGGDAVAAGVAGLAVGALLGSALSEPRSSRTYIDDYPVYDEPAPVYRRSRVIVTEPSYVVRAPLRPWSRAWMNYCSQRYRSFDPGTGTYVGMDGEEHFCEG